MRRPLRPSSLLLPARPLATLSLAPCQTVPVARAAIRLHRRSELLAHLHRHPRGSTRPHRRGSTSRPWQRPSPLARHHLTTPQRAIRLAVHRTPRAAYGALLAGQLLLASSEPYASRCTERTVRPARW